jgi:hypothetical protein
MGDWLGTGAIAPQMRTYRLFTQAREYARSLKIKGTSGWRQFCNSNKKPDDIPANPSKAYQNTGWVSLGDWLGTGTIATHLREYKSFIQARKYVHSLDLKNVAEWKQFCVSGKRPEYIPANPNRTYKNAGWISWGDWLGTGVIALRFKKYRSFLQARQFTHSLNLKSSAEWQQFCKSGKKPEDISTKPERTYKNKGWIGMRDWLGTEII